MDASGIVLYPVNLNLNIVTFYNQFGSQFSTTFKVLKTIAEGTK